MNIRNKTHTYTHCNDIRPGRVIRDILIGAIPLIPGAFVQEASVAELFLAYKRLLYIENSYRFEGFEQKGMTCRSFRNYMRHAHGLKLIEYVKTVTQDEPLYAELAKYVETKDGFEYGNAMRKVFKITQKGQTSSDWDGLCGAYREKHKKRKRRKRSRTPQYPQ